MSLLMKALEKAAKDRGTAQTGSAAKPVFTKSPIPVQSASASASASTSTSTSTSELTLEPLNTETPSFQPRLEPVQKSAVPPSPPQPGVSAAASDKTQDGQIKAATVIKAASKRSAGGLGLYIRSHPLVAIGSAAGLFLAGFGVYVYLQIFNPGLLVRQSPPAPRPPLVQAPTPPIATSSLIKPATEAEPPQSVVTPVPQAKPAVPAAPPKPEVAETPRNTITISRTNTTATISPLLAEAYAALENNTLDAAQRLYSQLLEKEPKNIDALLGLAAIAAQEGKTDEATRHYLQILELDPQHALAQSGLISLLGRADPLAAESRLKQLISREPSPFLYFTLGNLYADQSLWAQAQQAYFQAHYLDPANPDYAYNLAVGLEHVSQPKLALGYYRRAIQLASLNGHAHFSLPQAQERITKLASRAE